MGGRKISPQGFIGLTCHEREIAKGHVRPWIGFIQLDGPVRKVLRDRPLGPMRYPAQMLRNENSKRLDAVYPMSSPFMTPEREQY